MDISRSFDNIYNDLLTAHYNKSGYVAGLLWRIFYWAVAVMGWGLYRCGNYIGKQITPDTAVRSWLEKHAKMRGLTIDITETDAELLQRIVDDIQYPPAGGCPKDWERWVKEVSYTHNDGEEDEWTESVVDVVVSENDRGAGSINVVVVTDRSEDGYEGVATAEILSAISDHLDVTRPLGLWDHECYSAAHLSTDVTIGVVAEDYTATEAAITEQLTAFLNNLRPGEVLSLAQIDSIAIQCGATDCTITVPSANVEPDDGPTSYERITAGTITVSEL
jgi:uncharacterized phage protein gp47/JayE